MEEQVEVPTNAPAPAPQPAPAPEPAPAPAPEPVPEETLTEAPTDAQEASNPAPEETPTPADAPAPDTISVNDLAPAPTPQPAPAPEVLTLEDILNEHAIKQAKEQADKALIETIASQSPSALKPILVQWAQRGFPAAFPIYSIVVTPPSSCLDGVTRSLADYIVYLTGKPIEEHVCELCCKLQGMTVSFANINGALTLVVSRS